MRVSTSDANLADASDVAAGRFARWAMAAIVWYQRATEGRPSPCRFTPSCSAYALESFEEYSSGRALWLTVRRFIRCRPFGPTGYDPVPSPADESQHVHDACDPHSTAETHASETHLIKDC